MPTETFTSDGEFEVPQGNSTVTIRCYGERGEDGSSGEDDDDGDADHSHSDGSPGGYAEGTLSVTPGETLYIRIGGGGASGGGGTASFGDSAWGQSGRGGDAADVRQGGDTVNDVVIGAGGGGGGAAAAVAHRDGGSASAVSSGAGGGSGQDASTITDRPDGTHYAYGGESGGYAGGDGSSDSGYGNGGSAKAWGGGGGGGFNGGQGGNGDAWQDYDQGGYCDAQGGAGGDGYTAGVSNSTQQIGYHSGDAYVEIEYNDAVTRLSAISPFEDQVTLSWDDVEWETGYRVLRAQSSGSTSPDDYTEVASLGPDTTDYVDDELEDGERYYYRIEFYDDVDSGVSNEDDAITPLPAPKITTIDNTATGELTVHWEKLDDSSDGSFEVYRSADGSLGTLVHSTTDLSATSYTDEAVESGETYYYTVRRITDHAQTDSSQQVAGILARPTAPTSTIVDNNEATVTWEDRTGNEEGYRVLWRKSSSDTWDHQSSDLAANTEEYTVTGLDDGEEYEFIVEVFSGASAKRPLEVS